MSEAKPLSIQDLIDLSREAVAQNGCLTIPFSLIQKAVGISAGCQSWSVEQAASYMARMNVHSMTLGEHEVTFQRTSGQLFDKFRQIFHPRLFAPQDSKIELAASKQMAPPFKGEVHFDEVALDQWISVEERLPQLMEICIVYGRVRHVWSRIAQNPLRVLPAQKLDGTKWVTMDGNRIFAVVTHWQPLPPPPTE